ncbi:YraN family protein [Desulfothermobacter acidiphilus]|uniref:YraN family protein n=1 Tax=Desulfothermobacter acidiphilus TaxID=1938353 RepID=UPI003F8CEFF5
MFENRARGKQAEELAVAYLQRAGWQILERNFRCRWGEIDLVAREGDTVVFVEVRSRSNLAFGSPEESIGWHKRERMKKAVRYFIGRYGREFPCRFDVIAIVWDKATGKMASLRHWRNVL